MAQLCALVIDDEPAIREAVELSLSLAGGWDVHVAASGAEGVRIAQANAKSLDVILMDQMMPGMTGLEAFELLQAGEATRSIPVIFLTAKVQPRDRERFAAAGVLDVIAKPFDAVTLSQIVRQVLDRARGPIAEGAAALVEIWRKHQPLMLTHVADIRRFAEIERSPDAQAGPDAGLERSAHDAAHLLIGVMGTFDMKNGCQLARKVEEELSTGLDVEAADRVIDLSAQLRLVVEAGPAAPADASTSA